MWGVGSSDMKLKAKIFYKSKTEKLKRDIYKQYNPVFDLVWFGWLCWFFSIGLVFFDSVSVLCWFLCLSTLYLWLGLVVCIQISVSGDCILELGVVHGMCYSCKRATVIENRSTLERVYYEL